MVLPSSDHINQPLEKQSIEILGKLLDMLENENNWVTIAEALEISNYERYYKFDPERAKAIILAQWLERDEKASIEQFIFKMKDRLSDELKRMLTTFIHGEFSLVNHKVVE